ncbi:hypothetical protein, variant [Allomyces macrogynus ATCC 38327]|nr:hypothetical protein, variant [Allomyces macrogynus ATCC 38327]|eukprot:KNE71240.1 hypothetical protein, variant [Allomyces macrogynus ATCC 38327]
MDVSMRGRARRVWVVASQWARNVQSWARQPCAHAQHQQGEEEAWTPMQAALRAGKPSATHVVVAEPGCATVHVEDHGAPWTTRIEFCPAARRHASDRSAHDDNVVAFTNLPIPCVPPLHQCAPQRRPIYFEVTVLAISSTSTVAIGFVRQPLRPVRMPGWHRGSIGYDAVTGCVRYCPSRPAAVVGPATTHPAVAFGVEDVVGVAICDGKVTYTRNGEDVVVVEEFAESDVHVAVGATGPCTVVVQWDAPWRWAEANERGYEFYVVGDDAARPDTGGLGELASLALPKDDDAPPPYSRNAGSSSGLVRRKSM